MQTAALLTVQEITSPPSFKVGFCMYSLCENWYFLSDDTHGLFIQLSNTNHRTAAKVAQASYPAK